MAVHTEEGTPCPCCDGKETTEFVALKPLLATVAGSNEQIVAKEPHTYSIGKKCYLKQRAEVYPDEDPKELEGI